MIIVVDAAVAKLLNELRSSCDMPKHECGETEVDVLEKLGLVQIDPGENGQSDRVRALPGAWTVEVHV